MKTIPLTQGKFAIVDDEIYDFINQWKWLAILRPNTFYVSRRILAGEYGYHRNGQIWMHRVINKTPVGLVTDHVNGDGLDNRKVNLRTATSSQNGGNRKPNQIAKSRHKGVSWNTRYQRWRVDIKVGEKRTYLGLFHDEDEAAAIYNAASERLFGEFHKGNVI